MIMGEEGTITMKRRRHTPEQVIRKLREADRMLGEGKAIPRSRGRWRSARTRITGGSGSSAG